MKNIICCIIFSTLIFSCTSSENKTTEESKSNNQVGVQNANGGIPDTTNSINLSTQKKDTTMLPRDTMK